MTRVTSYLLSFLSLSFYTFVLSMASNAASCPTEQQISNLHVKHHDEPHHTLKQGNTVKFEINGRPVVFKVIKHDEKPVSFAEQLVRQSTGVKILAVPSEEANAETCTFDILKKDKTIRVTLEKIK